MKIYISALLLIVEVFLRFGESNTAGNRPSGSRSRVGEFRLRAPPRLPDITGPPTRIITYGPYNISVWLDRTNTKVLKADYPGSYVPRGQYYKNSNFMISLLHVEGLKLVQYVSRNHILLGVRAPNPKGTVNTLEPNESTWYIVFWSRYFKVKENTATKHLEGISLIPNNLHLIEENRDVLLIEKVDTGDVHFLLFRNRSGVTLGAELDPDFHKTELHED